MIIFSSSLPKSSRAKMKEKSSFVYIILVFVLRIFRHDIAEILLKVELNTKIQIHSILQESFICWLTYDILPFLLVHKVISKIIGT